MRSAVRAAKRFLLSHSAKEFTILAGPCRGLKVFAPPRNNQQLRFGLYERETHRYLRRAASSACWCIDVGAGFGELSMFFSLRAKAAPVFAIEAWAPDVLAKQLALNDAREIIPVTRYVGPKLDQVRLVSFPVPATKGFIKIDV